MKHSSLWLAFCLFPIFFPVVMTGDSQPYGTIPGQPVKITLRSAIFTGSGEGEQSTEFYRIPAIVNVDGVLLAAAEGRNTWHDPGYPAMPIMLAVKRSTDRGETWSEIDVIASDASYDYSDPRFVVDNQNERVMLFYTRWADDCGQSCTTAGDKANAIFYRVSTDKGATWGDQIEITSYVKADDFQSINTGPGAGTQTKTGRLLFPAIARDAQDQYRTFSIISDNGTDWFAGPLVERTGTTEGQIIQLDSGDLLLSSRNDGKQEVNRNFFISKDNGFTWVETKSNLDVQRVAGGIAKQSDLLLFSSPINQHRLDLGIWISYDNGQNWTGPQQITSGWAGYSQLVTIEDEIGIVYETDENKIIRWLKIKLNGQKPEN